jgi:phage terminase large subunit-like protein
MIICRGTGQQVVGLKHGDQRPTLIILDDPEDMMNTKTTEAMDFNQRWLFQALLPSTDPLRGKVCVIGTPQHQRCIVETLDHMEGWTSMRYKAIQADGTALWPQWWPIDRLLEEKASLESINRVSAFYREMQCEVVGDEDQLFKESYLRYWEGRHFHQNGYNFLEISHLHNKQLPHPMTLPVNVFTGVDPASSTSQTADYSTIVSIAIDAERNRYVLPYWRKRVSPMALAEAILARNRVYRPEKTRVESVGYQEMLREYLRTQAYIPGLELRNNPRNSKSNRLETLEPFFFQGKVFVQPNMQELKDELLIYPRGKHDDLLDGLYYAIKGNYAPSHSVRVVEPEISQLYDHGDEEDDGWVTA